MTKIFAVIVFVVLVSQSEAAELPGLIDQSLKSATESYEQLVSDPKKQTPRLWIHVHTEQQEQEVRGKLDWFQNLLMTEGRKVEVMPIQRVTNGPEKSQLRYFRKADMVQAKALFAEIKKAIPQVLLQDFSRAYQRAAWIEPGHLELWLGPQVSRIAVP